MALSSLLRSESANFSEQFDRSFVHGCGLNQTDLGFGAALGDSASFAVKALGDVDEAERKIEFLHGTTTLAFKVSPLTLSSGYTVQTYIPTFTISNISTFNVHLKRVFLLNRRDHVACIY